MKNFKITVSDADTGEILDEITREDYESYMMPGESDEDLDGMIKSELSILKTTLMGERIADAIN